MYIPYVSPPRNQTLGRRKGGGGGGKGGGSSSGSGKGGSSGSGSPKGGGSSGSGSSGSSSSSGKGSSWWGSGKGGGSPKAIASGMPFAGRMAGGGTRDTIYGSRSYGSGYPGIAGRGVDGRGFPYWFYPVVWPMAGVAGGEYFITRLMRTFTFHILSDSDTMNALYSDITANCSSFLSTSSQPLKPEQVVQYYRASSIALTLDGYNNTATYAANDSAPDSPLPDGYDGALLYCLNGTIGQSAVLLDGANEGWFRGSGRAAH
ncbi:hypothetical protein BDQ17DRAFT_1401051 [Cyathus striatus]|nr:hypothetical protein BDQ17DRAFT_1401051 [Cyathus striatus]